MPDFSSITSLSGVEDARQSGVLTKVLLLPVELGGEETPENTIFVPPFVREVKDSARSSLIAAISMGMDNVTILPEYRGASFVPSKLTVTAARSGSPPEFRVDIDIW